jgi:nicotinate-nucleotide adenylyltransferase
VSRFERIGIFGGTFDPIHNAHLDIARAAMSAAQLDRVIFVVSARPPHKDGQVFADAEDRFAMVRVALTAQPGMEASRIELDRTGPSYMVDTLRHFEREYPGSPVFLILGYDSLLDLPKWRDPQGILRRADILVAPRADMSTRPIPELEGHYEIIPFKRTGLSSTEIRERITSGQPVDEWMPAPVVNMIERRGLYRS